MSRYHEWTAEELEYIKENAGKTNCKEIAAKFNVSVRSVRYIIYDKLPNEISDKYRMREKGVVNKTDIICPYYTSTVKTGIKCDKRFVKCLARNQIRSHILNHCAKQYPDEKGEHCNMRQMLNKEWEMIV